MDGLMFWLLVFPLLLVAGLFLLKFAVAGGAVMKGAGRARSPLARMGLLVLGAVIVVAPFLGLKVSDMWAEADARARQEWLAELPRADLGSQRPRKLLVVGHETYPLLRDMARRHGLSAFPEEEAARLSATYRTHLAAESCLRRNGEGAVMRGTRLPVCRKVEGTLPEALDLREDILVLAFGSATSQRQSNVSVGKMYELRLVGPQRDALVDYYEQSMIRRRAGILRPFSSGWRLDPDETPLRAEEFLARALEG